MIVDDATRRYYDARAHEYDDGSEHRVYQRYFSGDGLLAELGGEGELLFDGRWFVMVRVARPRQQRRSRVP